MASLPTVMSALLLKLVIKSPLPVKYNVSIWFVLPAAVKILPFAVILTVLSAILSVPTSKVISPSFLVRLISILVVVLLLLSVLCVPLILSASNVTLPPLLSECAPSVFIPLAKDMLSVTTLLLKVKVTSPPLPPISLPP